MKTWGSRIKWACTAIALSIALLCCAVFSFVFLNNEKSAVAGSDSIVSTETDFVQSDSSQKAQNDSGTFGMMGEPVALAEDIETIWNNAVTQSKLEGSRITVTLTADWKADTSTQSFGTGVGFNLGRIYIPKNADMVIDLNGHTIDRQLASPIESGSVICVNGTLTLKDTVGNGVIMGGNDSDGDYGGGGVLVADGGTLTTSVKISNNVSAHGGGISVSRGSTLYVEGGSISQNTATSSCSGGIYAYGSSVYINSGSVSYNQGGIYVNSNSYIEMNGGNVSYNTHNDNGGILIRLGSTFVMNAGEVSNNENLKNIGYAGGVTVKDGSEFTLNGGSIAGNICHVSRVPYNESASGGVLIEGRNASGKMSLFIMNGGSISGNDTGTHGGGVGVFDARFILNNGTISGNTHSLNNNGWSAAAIFLRDSKVRTEYTEESANFVMYGGSVNSNKSEQVGAIHTASNVYMIMRGGEFVSNSSGSHAGAILLWNDDGSGTNGTVPSVVGGRLDMYGGSIRNNFSHGAGGGGVGVGKGCVFNMYGGEIVKNYSINFGGGIMSHDTTATINLYGGLISGNIANYSGLSLKATYESTEIDVPSYAGGGVYYTNCNFTIGGNVQIYNNSNGYRGTHDDIYIAKSWKKIQLDNAHPLTSAKIWFRFDFAPKLSAAADPTATDAYNIVENATSTTLSGKDIKTYFTSYGSYTPYTNTNHNLVLSTSGNTIQAVAGSITLSAVYWRVHDGTDYIFTSNSTTSLSTEYTGKTFTVVAASSATGTTNVAPVTASATTIKNAGTYTFSINNNGSATYHNATFMLVIEKVELNINWSNNSFFYTGVNVCPTPTVIGAVNGESPQYTLNKPIASVDAGTYSASVSLTSAAINNNYTLNLGSANVTYTIKAAVISKPYSGGTLVYDGNEQLLIGGFDSVAMIAAFDADSPEQKNVIYGINAGTYNAIVTLSNTKNYRWEDGTTSAVYITSYINKATLSVSGISLAAKEYDGTNYTTLDVSTLAVLGVVNKDYGSDGEIDKDRIWIVPVDYDTGAVATSGKIELTGSTAGRYSKKIMLQLSGTMKDNYTLLSDVYECITYITRATIKVTGGIDVATDKDGLKGKVYDGNTTVNFDTSNAVIVYSANGNTCSGVTVAAYGGYTSVNAGSSVSALIWSLKLGGTLAANYELDVSASLTALNDGSITGEITKKDVTAVITAGDCVYGGVPSVTYAVTGAVAGEDIKLALSYLNGTDSTTALKTAGVYTISAALTAEFANNYNLKSVTPNGGVDGDPVEVEITKAPLTITVYDAEVAFGGGKVNNGAFVTGLVWSDTRASLSIENGDLTFTYGDFDTDNGAVGSYVLSIDKTALSLANYTVTVVDGTLAVGLKNVTVTLTVTNGIYGGTGSDAASATATAALSDGTAVTPKINITYSGTSFDGTVYTNSTAVPVKPGEYEVVAAVDTASGYTGRTSSLLKIGRASLTVTVSATTSGTTDKAEYGTEITNANLKTRFKLTYSGWVNGDENDSMGNPTQTGDIVPANAKWSTDYFRYAPVGAYDVIVSGLTSDNYEITYVNGTLTVEKANATVTLKNQSSVYDGHVPVAGNVTNVDFTVSGLKRSADDLGVSISIASAAKNAGVYDLEASASNGNYNVTFVGETASNTATDNSGVWTIADAYTVNKAQLTITADDKTITYGDSAPAFTATYDGFIGADGTAAGPAAGVFSTELALGCAYVQFDAVNGNAGAYDITEATAAVADNYDITFIKGKLTVEKKAITVTVDRTKTVSEYGKTPIDFSVNTSDYYTFNTADLAQSTDDLLITLTHGVTTASDAGTYVITAVSGNANYDVTFTDCVYTVEQYKITVEWVIENADGSETPITAGDVPEFEYNGAMQGPKAYFNMPTGKIPVTSANISGLQKNAGTGYKTTVVIPAQYKGNYTFDASTNNTQAFEIKARELTITWSAALKDSDGIFYFEFNEGIQQHPTATFGNVVAGETVDPVYVGATGLVCTSHTVEVQITDKNYSLPSNTTVKYYITQMSLNSFYWTSDGTNNINASTYTYTYDGETHMPTAMAGVSVTFSYVLTYSDGTSCGNRAVNAGEYTVTAVPSDSNYAIPAGVSNKFTFTIAPKEVKSTDVYYDTLTFEYTGNEQMPLFWYTDVNGARIYLDASVAGDHKDAATYTAEISAPNDKNYAFTGNAVNYTKQYTIAPKEIEVEWTLNNGSWVTDFVDDYNGSAVSYTANAKMNSTYPGEHNAIGLKFEVTRKDSATGTAGVWTGDIRDAGIYTLRVYVSDKTLASNYNIKEFTRQITIDKLPLQITVNGGNDYNINYNDVAPKYTADFNGFVPVYTDASGNSVDESVTVKAAVEAVENWIFSQYIRGAQPGSYDVTLTTDSDKLKVLRQILRNYDWEQSFKGVKVIVNSTTGTVLVLADNGTNEFVYDGTSKLPEAFYTPTTGNGQQRKLDVSLLEVNPDGSPNGYLTDGKAINEGIYYISVKRVSGDTDMTELLTNGLYFKIIRRTVIVKISDREADYGEVTQTNRNTHIVTEYLSSYGGRNGYLPLAADEAGLAINVDCRFLLNNGTSNYDVQGYAQVGEYLIEGTWNSDVYSANYEVIFVGSESGVNGQFSAGVFKINKADITVLSNGDNFFEEYGDFDSSNPRYVIKLADKTDGVYNNIVYSGNKRPGNTDAQVTIKYVDKQILSDAVEPKNDAEYNLTDAPRITAAGDWIIYYFIDVAGGNHNKYYGAWRVQIRPEEDFIIVIFEKEFTVPYGDGVPDDLTEQLFNGGYYRMGNNAVSKEWFRDNATAYVAGVTNTSEVGLYNIFFEINDDAVTGSLEYIIKYSDSNYTPETNVGKYRIQQRLLTVNWSEGDEFEHDGEAHLPELSVTGWIDGGTLTPDGILANGERRYIYKDGNKEIVITLTADGDFTEIGGHALKVAVGNSNYCFEVTNAVKSISIKADTVVEYGHLPAWAWYTIGGAAAVLALAIVILAVKLKRRKAVVGGTSDDEGFYEEMLTDETASDSEE